MPSGYWFQWEAIHHFRPGAIDSTDAGRLHTLPSQQADPEGLDRMEIVTTCIDCWQPSATFLVNSIPALTLLGIAVWRTA